MRICCGWARKPMTLSLEQRYHPEQLMNRLPIKTKSNSSLAWMPVWIHVDSHYVRLNGKEELELACKLACIYHNGLDNRAPYCEYFDEDWQFIDRECVGVSKASSEDE